MTRPLNYEVVRANPALDEYRVEAIDYEDEGKVYVTVFTGPNARERAEEYAALKNARVAVAV